jgi:hypothetical protein
MISKILLAAALTMSAAACIGDVESDSAKPPGTSDTNPNPAPPGAAAGLAQKAYEDNVFPQATEHCSGCHITTVPAFLTADKALAYNQAVGFNQVVGNWTPDGAGIYKIPAIPAHASVKPWTQAEKDTIAAWLQLEVAARAGGTAPPAGGGENAGQASARLTAEFQKCMSQADFTAEQVATRIANQQSDEGSCDKCHVTGRASFIANSATNPDLLPMFPVLKTDAYFLSTYFNVNVAAKPYKIDFNAAAFERVATGKFPHQNHPSFNTTIGNGNAAGLNAARAFMAKTLARLDADGNCKTPPAQ